MVLFDRIRKKQALQGEENDENDVQGQRNATPIHQPIYRTATLSAYDVRKSIGWKIRDGVGYLERKLGPYLKKIFPNFIAVHYGYITIMTILGSILIYPVKNIDYIDALFLAACSATQAGLNTVNVNDLVLYQQIVIYVMAMFCTPIFIHGSLAFLRLYWFERHFDDIRETSKLNSKMRRTATLAARTQSMERQRTMESQRSKRISQNGDSNHIPTISIAEPEVSKESPASKTDGTTSSSSSEMSMQPQLSPSDYTQSQADLYNSHPSDSVEHMSEPSSDDGESHLPPQNRTIKFANDEADKGEPKQEDRSANIKFADSPKPQIPDRDDPKDVYRSLAMMRDKQATQHYDSGENQGPALVVHGPAERSSDSVKNSSLQFELAKPKRPLHNRKRSGMRRSFLLRRGFAADADDNIDDALDEVDITNISADDGENELQRAQSHLQLPSSDQSGGVKFTKRSNTLGAPTKEDFAMGKSPTFDKFVKRKLKTPKVLRRRLSSSVIDDESEYDPTDSDDEEPNESRFLKRQMSSNYLSWVPTVGRNSTFVNLSDQQKEELGGVEYRAIKLLGRILIVYYIGFHIVGITFLLPWIIKTHKYQAWIKESGVNLSWWAFFTSASSFNDLGYTLTPDSMISFRDSTFALLVSSVLIVIGNTGFPILLRFIIWILFKCSRELSLFQESLAFLLDHPRRCFTLLFPSAPTWWLFFILLVMNAVDLILFIVLDLNASVVEDLSAGHKVLDGFYQAVSTRTAGFACVDLSQLHPAVQVSYMVMMYISVMPLAISIRRTNVYEEQSLGVYAGKSNEHEHEADDNQKATSFIGAHLRKQLSFDLWFVFLGLFVICIAEGNRIQNADMPSFGVFQIMFEVVSAYGTVGMSLGYPGIDMSFSAKFTVLSKLVVIAMMIRGRHRGLPYSLDRAIMLPSAKMEKRDRYQDLHAGHAFGSSETIGSVDDPVIQFFKSAAPKMVREHMRRPSFFTSRSNSKTHRRNTSNLSNLSELSGGDARSNRSNRSNRSEGAGGAGDYFSRQHPTDDYSFRDIHFSHTNLAPVESVQSKVLSQAESCGPTDQIELDDLSNPDGGAVRVSETAVDREALAMGSRRNSMQTL